MQSGRRLTLSVIIPVHNDAEHLAICLEALIRSLRKPDEIIVVDDGSTDGSGEVGGRTAGVRLVTLSGKPAGPAYARNRGAQNATGNLLIFLDSDVRVHPDTLKKIESTFTIHPDLDALFGSYDDSPSHSGLISRFKNLSHHYIHQTGKEEASTFWSGCGAIRKGVFDSVGGFDDRFPVPSIEDIELGMRLKESGYKIRLQKDVFVTHMKRCTLFKWIGTDTFSRAVPWTRLILIKRKMSRDLNLSTTSRWSAVFAWIALLGLVLMIWNPLAGLAGLAALFCLAGWNLNLWRLFYRKGGIVLSAGGFFLHGLYLLYSSLTFVLLWSRARIFLHVPFLLVLITLVQGVVWSLFIPPFFGQDEIEHFMTAQTIARRKRLAPEYTSEIPYEVYLLYRTVQVAQPDPEFKPMDLSDPESIRRDLKRLTDPGIQSKMIDPGDEVSRVHNFQKIHPPLYYVLCACIQSPLEGKSIIVRVFACRLFSILLGCVTVLFAYFTGRLIWPHEKHFALLLAILVCFHPQLNRAYFSAVSNGALETALFSAYIWMTVRILCRRGSGGYSVALGMIIGLGLLTKISFVSVLASTCILYTGMMLGRERSWRDRLRPLQYAGFSVFIALVISWWWYLPRMTGSTTRLVNTWGVSGLKQNVSFLSFLFREEGLPVLRTMIARYWGHIHTGGSLYEGMVFYSTAILTGIVLFWLIREWIRSGKDSDRIHRKTILSLGFLGSITLLLGAFYMSIRYRILRIHNGLFPLWARYFLPAVIGQMAWLMTGMIIPFRGTYRRIPVIGLSVGVILMNFLALFYVVKDRVYGSVSIPDSIGAASLFQPVGPGYIEAAIYLWAALSILLMGVLWKASFRGQKWIDQ